MRLETPFGRELSSDDSSDLTISFFLPMNKKLIKMSGNLISYIYILKIFYKIKNGGLDRLFPSHTILMLRIWGDVSNECDSGIFLIMCVNMIIWKC